jgi:hypothetical protein
MCSKPHGLTHGTTTKLKLELYAENLVWRKSRAPSTPLVSYPCTPPVTNTLGLEESQILLLITKRG